MGIFSSVFGSSENERERITKVNWIPLVYLAQLNEIIALSTTQPVLLFKHSTTCGISRMALKRFESEFDLNDKVASYFLDLLNYRVLSNEIAERFGVRHESPQLLLIQDGKCVYDLSHAAIDVANLRVALCLR